MLLNEVERLGIFRSKVGPLMLNIRPKNFQCQKDLRTKEVMKRNYFD